MTPPSAQPGLGARHRFETTAGPGRRVWIPVALGIVVVMGGGWGISAALPRRTMDVVMPVFMLVFVVAYFAVLAFAFRGKKIVLDVERDRLLVDEGRGGVFPLAGAALGPWRAAGLGVTAGTVLHLAADRRKLRIGGRDHRPGAALRVDAPVVENVDVLLPARDFDVLLAFVPHLAAVGGASSPHHAPLRFALLPNPASARTVVSMMLPWFATLALVSVVGVGLASLGLYATPLGQEIGTAITVALIVAGLAVTVLHSVKKRPALEIETDLHELRLRDPRSGAIVAAAPLSVVSRTRGTHRTSGRATMEHPVLELGLPGRTVTLGVYDPRFGWNDAAPRLSAPRYIVGPPDWSLLVEVLGLHPFVVVRDEAA
jgi:FtsH-binding integral membrane protein